MNESYFNDESDPPVYTETDMKEAQADIERYGNALREIADDPHCIYDNAGSGMYGVGVADGHRCAANKARAALNGIKES